MNQLKDSEMLTPYHASDRRVYNGAPCSDMERERKRTAYLDKRMKQADATAWCTYFPAEEQYLVFINESPPRQLTGTPHDSRQGALIAAIHVLETPQQEGTGGKEG